MKLKKLIAITFLTLSVNFLMPCLAISGAFRVSPVKLYFDQGVRSGVITVFNESEGPLRFQIKGFEWTQDEDGEDQYEPSSDLVFFPKLMELGKGESRIIRAGLKQPGRLSERTFRIFIEEIPLVKQQKEPGSFGINILIQFSVPIFVKPTKEEVKGIIEALTFDENKLNVHVSNTGNSHFRIESFKIKGSDINNVETFSKELSGWYLLAGADRMRNVQISQEECQGTDRIDVEVKTRQFMLHDQLDVIKSLCMP